MAGEKVTLLKKSVLGENIDSIIAILWEKYNAFYSQAPAPVAFPMTTPQVPVYGMVNIILIKKTKQKKTTELWITFPQGIPTLRH